MQNEIAGQPDPFTPGISKAEVRQHAFLLYRDKLRHHPLSLEDWVLAEKDLVRELQTDGVTAEQPEGR
jgi:hypothetical protein